MNVVRSGRGMVTYCWFPACRSCCKQGIRDKNLLTDRFLNIFKKMYPTDRPSYKLKQLWIESFIE